MIHRLIEIYRGDTYRGNRGLIFEDIPDLHLPSTTVQFSVKKNREDTKRVISFPITSGDPGNDWSEPVRKLVVNLETGHTQLLEGGIYFYDIEINYAGEIITQATGEFIIIPDIATTIHVVSPTTEASIYENLASKLESLGASLIGVVALFWDSITGSPNGTVESILRFLWNNKINKIVSPAGNRLLKSSTDGTIISETPISITPDGDVSGIRDLHLDRDLFVPGKIISQGNLIQGDVIQVEDKNIELGKVEDPDDDTGDGGGITLLGLTNKTFQWLKSKAAWVSSESIELIPGKQFLINGVEYVTSRLLSISGSNIAGRVLSTTGISFSFIEPPTAPVTSVNSKTGEVDLSEDYYGKEEVNAIVSGLMPLDITSDEITEGTVNIFYSDGRVKSMLLTGLPSGVNSPITGTDSLLPALAKLQTQINNVSNPFGVLDTKFSSRKFNPSPAEPWFRKDLDHTFDIGNWPLLIEPLRNIKWEFGSTSVFNVIGFVPGSVTRLQLEDTLLSRNLLRILIEDYQYSKPYTSSTNADSADDDVAFANWGMIVRIVTDIGTEANAPKANQEFRIKYFGSLANSLSVTNRYICIDKNTSSNATTGTGTIEITPYRIASAGVPNTSQARWRKRPESGLITPGAVFYSGTDLVEVPANANVRDRGQTHLHVYNAYQDGIGGLVGAGGIPYTYSSFNSSTPVSDNANGNPRNGPNHRIRSSVEYSYGCGLVYIP
ncbi:hypothetical protein [Leptospira meyeri]|uniref:hypothetical protein n=1 Tax=Leptospira meyeri TaxID=29508 RepID=UPI0010829CCC|nr:hypothetical protein [Leptospira meyeri]TGM21981.1 hypothetical protein EHQ73_09300 [Leptospira meyeri]